MDESLEMSIELLQALNRGFVWISSSRLSHVSYRRVIPHWRQNRHSPSMFPQNLFPAAAANDILMRDIIKGRRPNPNPR